MRTYNDTRSGQWLYGQQFIGTYNYPPSQNVPVAGPPSTYVIDAQTSSPLAFNPNFTLFSDPSPAGRLAGVRNIKYFPAPSSGVNANDMDNDIVVFRLAEIMLMKAEASLRLGDAATALTLVNQIRARAYGNTAHALTSIDLPTLLAEKGREEKIFIWISTHEGSVVGCWVVSICVMTKLHALKQRNHGLIQSGCKRFFYTPKHPDWLWVPSSHLMN
jgi:hypothetical protein